MEAIRQQKKISIKGVVATTAIILMAVAGFAQQKQTINASSESIRPFEYHADQAQLDDSKHRIQNTKWSDKELVNDNTQGVPQATIQALAKYWANDYDWPREVAGVP